MSSRLTRPVKQSGCLFMASGPCPPARPLPGGVDLPSGHRLSPHQRGVPGWSGPLGRKEGLDQHAPWGGRAPGPRPTFEKQVRLRVIQNTSQLYWPQSPPLGSPAPKTQRPLLLNGAGPSSRSALSASGFPPWRVSCRSGAVCLPLPPDTSHTGGPSTQGFPPGAAGGARGVQRPLADAAQPLSPPRSPPFSAGFLCPGSSSGTLFRGEKMASFYLFWVQLQSAFPQPSTSACVTFPETFERGVCPRVSLPWLSGSISVLLCRLHDAASSQRASRKVSAGARRSALRAGRSAPGAGRKVSAGTGRSAPGPEGQCRGRKVSAAGRSVSSRSVCGSRELPAARFASSCLAPSP